MLEAFCNAVAGTAKTQADRNNDTTAIPIGISEDTTIPPTVVVWQIDAPSASKLFISERLVLPERIQFVGRRLGSIWPLLQAYLGRGAPRLGQVNLNMEDHTVRPGISFCSRSAKDFLVPDAIFMLRRGYEDIRRHYANGGPPWEARKPAAFWRGATTGPSGGTWQSLPRIQLCGLSAAHPDMIDAGITNVVQLPPSAESEIRAAGHMRNHVPPETFANWRYQIDIDGNTSSWPGLFQKLLTGSPVLKVASPRGWRQWYYDRLKPWVNHVPIETDMRDLHEKIEWLRNHDATARAIGSAGRDLARSLTYEGEIAASVPVIEAAFAASS